MVIHLGGKHKKNTSSPIVQFYGNTTKGTIDINDTEVYWKSGWVGRSDKVFMIVNKILGFIQ